MTTYFSGEAYWVPESFWWSMRFIVTTETSKENEGSNAISILASLKINLTNQIRDEPPLTH